MRMLPLSLNLGHLPPRISSDLKPSQLHWALGPVVSQELRGRCKCFAFSIWKLCHFSAGYLGSYFKMAMCMLFQCFAWVLIPCSICELDWRPLKLFFGQYWTLRTVLWALEFKIFHIIFLKLFELYFRAIWVKLSGLVSFFLASSCLHQISKQPKEPP